MNSSQSTPTLASPGQSFNTRRGGFGGDIDGLFGLLVDNLIQLLVILFLLTEIIGFPREEILMKVMPAVGISVIVGNLFYALQALIGSHREGRRKTALPYGVNTPTVFVYILFIMLPVYQRTGEWNDAYAAGMLACIGSGLIEFFGAFAAKTIRRITPRAALLSALAGIALTFISMDFVVRIFADPLIALIPLVILLAGYFGKGRMPLGLPAGFVALVVGAASAWILSGLQALNVPGLDWIINDAQNIRRWEAVRESVEAANWYLPDPRVVWPSIRDAFLEREWLQYLGVIIPMGIFNLAGSLQNLESAEAAGDRYSTRGSLMVNGIGSILGGFLGSCFPTTIYIGHPGWKEMGAGWAYSLLNAIAIGALCLTGIVTCVEAVIPISAGAGILLWIGVIILAQAFTAVPKHHAGAVAVGLFPAVAGLIVMIAMSPYAPGPGQIQIVDENAAATEVSNESDENQTAEQEERVESDEVSESANDDEATESKQTLRISTLQEQLARPDEQAHRWGAFSIHGLIRLERGLLLISMIWAAMTVWLTERRWASAGLWAFAAAALTALGVIHGYALHDNDLYYLIPGLSTPEGAFRSYAWEFIVAYLLIGALLHVPSLVGAPQKRKPMPNDEAARLRRRMTNLNAADPNASSSERREPTRPAPPNPPASIAPPPTSLHLQESAREHRPDVREAPPSADPRAPIPLESSGDSAPDDEEAHLRRLSERAHPDEPREREYVFDIDPSEPPSPTELESEFESRPARDDDDERASDESAEDDHDDPHPPRPI